MYVQRISVKNYRSLRDVTIGDLSPLVILYGENNSGKSNVLSFLEHIFRQKLPEDVVELSGTETNVPNQSGVFWRGEIDNFSDNFYRNTNEAITFCIVIRFKREEITSLGSLPDGFLEALAVDNHYNHLQIKGIIEPTSVQRARMVLHEATFNDKGFFDGKTATPNYLPGFNLSTAESLDIFEKIMGKLNNAFLRISPDRFISVEKEIARGQKLELSPSLFKNWLFQISVGRDTEKLFRQISDRFESEPFNHGRVSLARVGSEIIEVFIEDRDALKLPVDRKGSGVQQILMILSFVTASQSPLIGIEEAEINLSPKSQKSVFDNLLSLVNLSTGPINQVFLTTHSPLLARRNEAERRGVWMREEDGATQIKKPSEAEIEGFFGLHF